MSLPVACSSLGTVSNPAEANVSNRSTNRTALILLTICVLVGIAVFAFSGIGSNRNPSCEPATYTKYTVTQQTNVVTIAKADASPTANVAVFFDYMCPYCGKFDRVNQIDLTTLLDEGKITLQIHVMSFLDRNSQGTYYSTRAANATLTVAAKAPQQVLSFHEALFANQPDGGTFGLSDTDLEWLARRVGVPEDVAASFNTGEFVMAIQNGTQADLTVVSGTPAVLINGNPMPGDLLQRGAVKQAVLAAM